jgi:endonuclease/exonuclease/phosphatase family metal-dependent hydrolase
MPKVLSLNVTDGGRTLHPTFAARLDELAPDLVTLQEIRSDTLWHRTLEGAGMHVADTFEIARQHGHPHPGPFREDGLLIASRWPSLPSTARSCPHTNAGAAAIAAAARGLGPQLTRAGHRFSCHRPPGILRTNMPC